MKKYRNSQHYWTSLITIALAATCAVLFWSIQADAYPLHNGEYLFWPKMPEAAQVLTDMKGTNDLDTAARQHAALNLLIALVNVAADGKGQTPWPAREQELNGAYYHALPDGDGHRAEMQAESLQLQADPSFVQPFLKRYFTEAAVREINMVETSAKATNAQRKAEAANQSTVPANAQGKAGAANSQNQPAVDQYGLTASEDKIVTAGVYACIAILTLMWLIRIFRLFGPFRTTSDDPPQFEGPWKVLKIHSFTGHVRGSATRSGSIHIDADPQGGYKATAMVINSFRLVNPRNQQEQNFQLHHWDAQLWDNQLVSVAWAIREHRKEGPCFIIVNHTTGEHFIRRDIVLKIAKQGSALWTLSALACICFFPVLLLVLIWRIIVGIKVSGFMSSGVQPLVQTLNQKAKKFL